MKVMKAILGLALMVGLVSCSSSHVASNYDREVDFARLKTFGWMSRTEGSTSLVHNTLLEKRIRNAVDQVLTSEGYQKETTGNPDFLIAYRTGVEDKSDITSYGYGYWPGYYTSDRYGYGPRHYRPYGYGYWRRQHTSYGYGYGGRHYRSYGYGYGPRHYGHGTYGLHQYKEGTVTLDFIDAESNKLLWRGWYVGAIADGEIGEEKIYTAVKHILEEFPPDEGSASQTIY